MRLRRGRGRPAPRSGGPTELSELTGRRVTGEPLEQVVGWAEFCGLRIAVDTRGIRAPAAGPGSWSGAPSTLPPAVDAARAVWRRSVLRPGAVGMPWWQRRVSSSCTLPTSIGRRGLRAPQVSGSGGGCTWATSSGALPGRAAGGGDSRGQRSLRTHREMGLMPPEARITSRRGARRRRRRIDGTAPGGRRGSRVARARWPSPGGDQRTASAVGRGDLRAERLDVDTVVFQQVRRVEIAVGYRQQLAVASCHGWTVHCTATVSTRS